MNITYPLRCATATDRAFRPPNAALLPLMIFLLLKSAPVPTRAADLFIETSPPGWTQWVTFAWGPEWGDYDNDGYLDAFMARSLTIDVTGAAANLIYHNNGDGSFTQKLAPEIGPIVSDRDVSVDGCWADANNDGYLDLLVVNEIDLAAGGAAVPSRLYMNRGNGTFTSIAAGALTQPHFTFGNGSWCDYDNDGWLDAFFCAAWADNNHRTNVLVHGKGDGTFDLVTDNAIATERIAPGACSVGAFSLDGAWGDLDGDGDVDLLVANYCLGDFLYRNDGRGRFTRMTNSLLEDDSLQASFNVMGDLDNDGDLDIAAAHWDGGTQVFFNQGDMNFVAGQELAPPVWPILLGDYDNDGDLDILGVPERYAAGRSSLWRNDGKGNFVAADEAFTRETARWAELSWADYDNDGFLDLIGGQQDGRNLLFRNQGNGNHWLKVRLVGTASNRSAIGAKIRVLTTTDHPPVWQLREISSSDSPEDGLRAHFGLGDATVAAEVRIEWPSGNIQTLTDVAADQILTVTEPIFFQPIQPVATINGSAQITNTVVATARQWSFEGALLEGQTGRILALTNIQSSHSGRYSVVAQTAAGPQTNHVYLRVLTQFTKILEGDIVTDSYGSLSATWFDDDNDGFLDLFVANSTFDTPPRVADNLYHNQGDGTFVKVLDSAVAAFPAASAMGAPGDFDNDGDLDLITTLDGEDADQLFRNDGKGNFSLVAGQPFSAPGAAGVACGWADYDLDGDIDLFAARGYGRENPIDDALYRNNGDGTFTAVTADQAGDLLRDHVSNWGMLWFDYNQDGAQDLFVTYNRLGGRLHRNNRDGTFSLLPDQTFGTMPGDGTAAAADYDNDGLLDLVVTPIDVGRTILYRNLGNDTFADVTAAVGIQAPPRDSVPFGTWADYDNDGFIDLFFGSYTTNCLYRNRGDGTFQSVNVGNLHKDGFRAGMGAWGDYDNNGFQDLYLVCGDALPSQNHLYRNNGNGNHWLKVKLLGTTSNHDGMGAKVRVKATIGGKSVTQMREISGNAGLSGGSLLAHFGLGSATNATTVRVEWPSGIAQEVTRVASDQVLTLTEPAPIQLTLSRVADGIRLEWRGKPNTFYGLQSSMGLTAWGTAQLVLSDASGAATATVPTDGTARFFRVVKQ